MTLAAGTRFEDVIATEEQLRGIIGWPNRWSANKVQSKLDAQCRRFIADSRFLVLASSGRDGNVDVSPKGDAPGFVRVLDDRTLAIPDRPGNRRMDSFRNVLENPAVGLIFFVPGRGETLRVGGRAMIVRDRPLRESMAIGDRVPALAMVIAVERAFFHCPKSVVRAKLWEDVGERRLSSGLDAILGRFAETRS